MPRFTYTRLAQCVVAALIAGAAAVTVGVPSGAFAAPAAPIVSASSTIDTYMPSGSNPNAHDLHIFGSFSGLRPGEDLAGYSMWVACDDLTTFNVRLTPVPGLTYPDGTVGGQLSVSFPAAEQGHFCRIQTSGPGNRQLLFTASPWRQFLGDWTMDLTGYAVTSLPAGGQY